MSGYGDEDAEAQKEPEFIEIGVNVSQEDFAKRVEDYPGRLYWDGSSRRAWIEEFPTNSQTGGVKALRQVFDANANFETAGALTLGVAGVWSQEPDESVFPAGTAHPGTGNPGQATRFGFGWPSAVIEVLVCCWGVTYFTLCTSPIANFPRFNLDEVSTSWLKRHIDGLMQLQQFKLLLELRSGRKWVEQFQWWLSCLFALKHCQPEREQFLTLPSPLAPGLPYKNQLLL
jgi:hypothetical protein